jgi:hypothetical protein
MNAVVEIRHESPATLARQEHEAALRALDSEEAGLREKIRRAEASKAPITALTEKRAAVQALLAAHVAADLDGTEPPEQDSADLHDQLGELELEIAAMQVQADGADLALTRLHARLADLSQRRATEKARRKEIERSQINERLTALAAGAESVVAPFIALYIEYGAAAAVRDRLKLPSEPWCADVFGKGKLAFPVPFGIAAFDAFGASRDVRPQIEARAQQILREIGAS